MRKLILLFALLFFAIISYSQRYLFPSNLLPNSTTRIVSFRDSILDGVSKRYYTVGTGFFYEFEIDSIKLMTIVTNKHVISSSKKGILTIKFVDSTYRLGNKIQSDTIEIQDFNSQWILHPSEDLAILPFDKIHERITRKHTTGPSFTWFSKAVIPSIKDSIRISSIEKVLMIGYPKSLWDSTNNLPVVRQGITATPFFSDFNGKKRFLIDIPTFSGSSGSPIVMYSFDPYWTDTLWMMNEFRSFLLGIAVESYTYNEDGKLVPYLIPPSPADSLSKTYKPQVALPINIAIAIRAERLNDFEPLLRALFLARKKRDKKL